MKKGAKEMASNDDDDEDDLTFIVGWVQSGMLNCQNKLCHQHFGTAWAAIQRVSLTNTTKSDKNAMKIPQSIEFPTVME